MQTIQILTQFVKNIEGGLKVIKCSRRLIDIISKKQGRGILLKGIYMSDREISELYGVQKDYDSQKINQIISKYGSFNVTFHYLIVIESQTEHDQAITLIQDASQFVNLNCGNINVNLKNIDSQILNSLLSPDLEIKQLNKQQVLDHLKSSKKEYKSIQEMYVSLKHL
ncbi:hypothetical protein ABPG74_018457 [Tetrahymena malaccensis]